MLMDPPDANSQPLQGEEPPSAAAGLHGEGSSSDPELQGEGSSSGAGPEPDWRLAFSTSVRVKNRALIAEALYVNDEQLSVDEAFTRAFAAEQTCYGDATSLYDYLRMVLNTKRRLRLLKLLKDLGTMPQQDPNYYDVPKTNQQNGEEPLSTDMSEDVQSKDSSSGAGPEPDWTELMGSVVNIINSALIGRANAVYENHDGQLPLDEADTTVAAVEQTCYQDAISDLENLTISGSNQRSVHSQEVSEELGTMSADTSEDLQRHIIGKEPLPADKPEDLQRHIKGKEPLPADTPEDLQKQPKGKEPLPADLPKDLQSQPIGEEPLHNDTSEDLQRRIEGKGKDPLPANTYEDLQRHIKGKQSLVAETSEDLERLQNRKKSLYTFMLKGLLHKHSVTSGCLKNIVLLFNMREPTSMTSQQQFLDRLHKLRASKELADSLDELTKHIESVQTRSEKDVWTHAEQIIFLESTYERTIVNILETFSKHINMKCNCLHGVTPDIDTGSSVDLNSKKNQPDDSETPVQQPLSELKSDGSRNVIPPRQQQPQQLGPNENQTDTSLDDALLIEYKFWINI